MQKSQNLTRDPSSLRRSLGVTAEARRRLLMAEETASRLQYTAGGKGLSFRAHARNLEVDVVIEPEVKTDIPHMDR